MFEALLEEKPLLSNQLEHKVEYTTDDTACATLSMRVSIFSLHGVFAISVGDSGEFSGFAKELVLFWEHGCPIGLVVRS